MQKTDISVVKIIIANAAINDDTNTVSINMYKSKHKKYSIFLKLIFIAKIKLIYWY